MEKDKAKPSSQAWSGQQEEAQRGSVGPRRGRRGALLGDLLFVQFDIEEEPEFTRGEVNKNQQGTPGEGCAQPQLSPRDAHSPQQLSDWDEGLEPGLSQEESGSHWDFSDWEEGSKQELSQGAIKNTQEASDWEESPEQRLSPGEGTSHWGLSEWDVCSKQELPQGEARSQEVSEGKGQRRAAEQSSWEDNNDQKLWESSGVLSPWRKAWPREDNDWNKISVLELNEEDEEAKQQRLAALAREGFTLPVPREAQVERRAPEPRCRERPRAGPGPVAAPAQVGHASRPGQGVPRRKRRWPFRWALQGLFRCPCLAARPED